MLEQTRADLQRAWQETSHAIQKLRDNPACADSEFALIGDNDRSALFADLKFDVNEDIAAPFVNSGAKPKLPSCANRASTDKLKWPPPSPAPDSMPTTCICPT